ncbi:MAG: hypothetical protein AABY11_00565 [archaeon]
MQLEGLRPLRKFYRSKVPLIPLHTGKKEFLGWVDYDFHVQKAAYNRFTVLVSENFNIQSALDFKNRKKLRELAEEALKNSDSRSLLDNHPDRLIEVFEEDARMRLFQRKGRGFISMDQAKESVENSMGSVYKKLNNMGIPKKEWREIIEKIRPILYRRAYHYNPFFRSLNGELVISAEREVALQFPHLIKH